MRREWALIASLIFLVAFWATFGYVAFHFIVKFW